MALWARGVRARCPLPRDSLIVKINDRPEQRMLPNKVVSDQFADTPDARVSRMLAYDWHQRTTHEVLVMRLSDGANLLEHAIDMPEAQLRSIFRQTCRLVARLHRFEFDTFGEINEVGAGGPNLSFVTCPEFLLAEFEANVEKIKSGRLADPDDMERIERYFRHPLVHNDAHFKNVLFSGDQLSSLIDWDGSLRGPSTRSLVMLLQMIDQPQCVGGHAAVRALSRPPVLRIASRPEWRAIESARR